MTPTERDRVMLTALESINDIAKQRKVLSTAAELEVMVLKMEAFASVALRKLENSIGTVTATYHKSGCAVFDNKSQGDCKETEWRVSV